MKKLMVAIAAAATALGLYAAGVDDEGFVSGTSFDDAGAITALDALNAYDTGATWSTEDSAATLEVKEYASGEALSKAYRPLEWREQIQQKNYLNVKTALDKPLTRAYESATSLASADFYVDTLVKFTACDEEITTLGDDTAKIAVWVKEDETSGKTNLMITAGYIENENGTVSAKNYDCGAFDGVDAWHRLTVKAIGDISDIGLVGFVVFIDGNMTGTALASDEAKGYDGYKAILSDVATLWDTNGQLFPSLKGKTARSISALAVAGQGAIDDIAFTATAPDWANKSAATITWDANVEYVVVTDGDNVSTNYTSPKAVEAGKTYTVEAKAKSGYALNTVTSPWTPAADATLEITTVPAAAEFDGIGYANFADALAAANKSTKQATLKLWDDVETNESFNNKAGNWILDLNGNAIDNVEVENGILKIIDSGNGGSVDTLATYEGVSVTIADGKYEVLDLADNTLVIEGGDAEFFDEITGGLEIADDEDLSKLALVVNAGWNTTGKTFLQTDNIDLTGIEWGGIGIYKKYTPLAGQTYFGGVYDGAGHSINGLTFPTTGDRNQQGLFRKVYSADGSAEIKNLTVNVSYDASDNGEAGAAAVVGVLSNAKITGVTANGSIKGGHACSGIAGMVNGNSIITDCTNNVDVVGYVNGSAKAGGICNITQNKSDASDGQNISGTPKFIRCVNTGDIKGRNPSNGIGGLVGYLDTPIEIEDCECYGSYAATSGTGSIGSIFGKKCTGCTSITVKGTNKAVADTIIGDAAFDGLNFATVDGDGIATFVKNEEVVEAAAAADATYKVMSPIASFAYQFTGDAGEIAFLTGLKAPTFTITDKAGNAVDPTAIEGGVKYVVSAQQGYPSDWPDADQGVKDKFADWRKDAGKDADLALPVSQQAFLLNVAPNAVEDLTIEEINVVPGGAGITVSLGGKTLANINGVLFVNAGDTLESMTDKPVATWEDVGGKKHAVIDAKFVKAVVGFKAPKAE